MSKDDGMCIYKFYLFKRNDKTNPIIVPISKLYEKIENYIVNYDLSEYNTDLQYDNYLEKYQLNGKNIAFLFTSLFRTNDEIKNKVIELINEDRKRNKYNPDDFDFISLMATSQNVYKTDGYCDTLRFTTPKILQAEANEEKDEQKEDRLIPIIYKSDLKTTDNNNSVISYYHLIDMYNASSDIYDYLDARMDIYRFNKEKGYETTKDEVDICNLWQYLLDLYYSKYERQIKNLNIARNQDSIIKTSSKPSIKHLSEIVGIFYGYTPYSYGLNGYFHTGFVTTYVEQLRIKKCLNNEYNFKLKKLDLIQRAFAAIYSSEELNEKYKKQNYVVKEYKKQTPLEKMVEENAKIEEKSKPKVQAPDVKKIEDELRKELKGILDIPEENKNFERKLQDSLNEKLNYQGDNQEENFYTAEDVNNPEYRKYIGEELEIEYRDPAQIDMSLIKLNDDQIDKTIEGINRDSGRNYSIQDYYSSELFHNYVNKYYIARISQNERGRESR